MLIPIALVIRNKLAEYIFQRSAKTFYHSITLWMHSRCPGLVNSQAFSQILKHWDQHIPLALMAYRSSVHESTGFSLSMLMFGREIELPIDHSEERFIL
jgi:hypothetical protein